MIDHNNPFAAIQPAEVSWQHETPFSEKYDDIYFSKVGGSDETDYVFLEQNNLPRRWNTWSTHKPFVVAETGFGTGLNFLRLLNRWRQFWTQQDATPPTLHFISFEKHPLTRNDLEHALKTSEQNSDDIAQLIAHYPSLTPGFHRLELEEGNILITLCFGDVNHLLPRLDATVHAWFLDGFAPSKNPDMWQTTLFDEIARCSEHDTTFATFTAASLVRKGLEKVGFRIEKVSGFGRKREMLKGEFHPSSQAPLDKEFTLEDRPWFLNSAELPSGNQKTKTAIVIGGGLAGTASAYSLAKRGWKVQLLEKQSALAQAGSGNPLGVLFTKLSPHISPQNRFYQLSYLHALEHVKQLLGNHGRQDGSWDPCGVFQLAFSESEQQRQQEIADCGLWPSDIAIALQTEQQIKEATGITCSPGLLFPNAGWVNPPLLCKARSSHPGIETITDFYAETLQYNGDGCWTVSSRDHRQVKADIVIIANAQDSATFSQTQHFPLKSIRGQVTFTQPTEYSKQLKLVLCYDGYCSPIRHGVHSVGATFYPKDQRVDLREEDHLANIKSLNASCPELGAELSQYSASQLEGRAGLRCQTPDYLPMIGPAPDREFFIEHYNALRTGSRHTPIPAGKYLKGLYVNLGHGSRGLTTTGISGEILAAYVEKEPQPIDREVLEAIHPVRFIVRDLKRRQI